MHAAALGSAGPSSRLKAPSAASSSGPASRGRPRASCKSARLLLAEAAAGDSSPCAAQAADSDDCSRGCARWSCPEARSAEPATASSAAPSADSPGAPRVARSTACARARLTRSSNLCAPTERSTSARMAFLSAGSRAAALRTSTELTASPTSLALPMSRACGRISSLPAASAGSADAAAWISQRHRARVRQTASASSTTSVAIADPAAVLSAARVASAVPGASLWWLRARKSSQTAAEELSPAKRRSRQWRSSRKGLLWAWDTRKSGLRVSAHGRSA
mmetsp:Transcript_14115/g.33353  ORF Transcript_14115/g.33353 Transcript_14115/m.33353 type:complete len:278 (-) Transcript_14115:280-1113(-)